ncbi:hypothetical protein OAA60_06060 [Porticoccaceae bacterium]|nr:hypothetical protein [Porticoccaceae bacterium]
MKSSIALLIMAGFGVAIDLVCKIIEYGNGNITTEIVMVICASHICRTLENKQ